MIIETLTAKFGDYNTRMDDPAHVLIDGTWYRCRVRNLPDIEHLLSVHPIRSGKINVRFDTGRCGPEALADDQQPAAWHLHTCGADYLTDEERGFDRADTIKLRWNPVAGNEGSRLFCGAFEFITRSTDGQTQEET